MPANQNLLPFGPLRNSELFSNHWLRHRLNTEPEWAEYRDRAVSPLARLAEIWKRGSPLIAAYGEQQLEHAFIHPVLQELRDAA